MHAAQTVPEGQIVYAVCIKGGPITQCEEYLMPEIVQKVKYASFNADKDKALKPTIVVAKLHWKTFTKMVGESKR